jgi:hypothetical protein
MISKYAGSRSCRDAGRVGERAVDREREVRDVRGTRDAERAHRSNVVRRPDESSKIAEFVREMRPRHAPRSEGETPRLRGLSEWS